MRKIFILALSATLMAVGSSAHGQPAKLYRVGVILQGGPFYTMVDGLRDGLKELGFVEGKQIFLEIRDTRGDLKAVEEAASSLEREKVNLLYTVATSVTIAAKQSTANTPIVFNAGTDPTVVGLVESFAKPGGRWSSWPRYQSWSRRCRQGQAPFRSWRERPSASRR